MTFVSGPIAVVALLVAPISFGVVAFAVIRIRRAMQRRRAARHWLAERAWYARAHLRERAKVTNPTVHLFERRP